MLLLAQVQSIGVLLNSMDPYCFTIDPKNTDQLGKFAKLNVQYQIVGVDEDNIEFTAKQDGERIYSMSMMRDSQFQLDLNSRSEVELCWRKLDRKTKKLNWMVT